MDRANHLPTCNCDVTVEGWRLAHEGSVESSFPGVNYPDATIVPEMTHPRFNSLNISKETKRASKLGGIPSTANEVDGHGPSDNSHLKTTKGTISHKMEESLVTSIKVGPINTETDIKSGRAIALVRCFAIVSDKAKMVACPDNACKRGWVVSPVVGMVVVARMVVRSSKKNKK